LCEKSLIEQPIENFLIRTPKTVSLPREFCRLTFKLLVQAGGASSLMTEKGWQPDRM